MTLGSIATRATGPHRTVHAARSGILARLLNLDAIRSHAPRALAQTADGPESVKMSYHLPPAGQGLGSYVGFPQNSRLFDRSHRLSRRRLWPPAEHVRPPQTDQLRDRPSRSAAASLPRFRLGVALQSWGPWVQRPKPRVVGGHLLVHRPDLRSVACLTLMSRPPTPEELASLSASVIGDSASRHEAC